MPRVSAICRTGREKVKAMKKKNILAIISDPQMLRTVNRELRKAYDVVPLTTVKDAKRFLEGGRADLILLDLNGDIGAENALIAHIRTRESEKDCPIILMRRSLSVIDGGSLMEIEALKIGASDVIRKPFSFETLRMSIARLLRRGESGTRGEARAVPAAQPTLEVRHLSSMIDRTTGLMNRAVFMERATRMIAEKGGALFLLDIDGLKQVNDRGGQQAGDDLIRRFAVLLRGCFDATAVIANLGGDDFAVYLPSFLSHEELQERADGILSRASREAASLRAEDGIAVSIGIAVAPDHGRSYDELFSSAEDALLFVKSHGKGFYCLGTDDAGRKEKRIEYHEETKKSQRLLLARRKHEKDQCWVKSGEYRLIWANNLRMHEIYGVESLSVLFTLQRAKRVTFTDDELDTLVSSVRDYFAETGISAVFSWYSESQFFMMLYRPEEAGEVIRRAITDLPSRLSGLDLSVQYEMISTSGHADEAGKTEGNVR